ncbi:hypothetical protein [Siccibacter colletis]|uniref:Uncharacterized protein n=1 Tax=Siccibacter colletis TaxID=1505757 RepID=A0ABY6JHP1_9ENTR|nr:hypothetical protein [Siccibacter colletis]UYU31971.1 hypothetical protein KFZ77_00185 [Siccibacter colletis]
MISSLSPKKTAWSLKIQAAAANVGGSVFSETTGKGAEAVVNKVKEKYEKK